MASTIRGINVQIGSDTTGLSRALSDVNKNARDIQTELRQVERLLKLDPTNTELLAQKQKLLGDAVGNTQEKLDRLRSVQEQVNDQFERGEIGEAQYRAYQREVAKTEQNLESLEDQLKDLEPAVKTLGEQFEEAGSRMSEAGAKMTDAGKKLSMRVTAPIAGMGAAILKTGIDFESAMSKVEAISGATEEDMKSLTEQAKELGATTVFSASEAAAGMEFLARAGFSVEDIMSAMPGMLDLAASAAIDLGTAADITSNIMSGFGLEANKAGLVADVLAAATARSNTSVNSMGESMKMVAPVSAGLGISLEETAAAIGILGDAGIQGGMAGTTLRAGLLRLASPTDAVKKAMEELGVEFFDAEGNMKSLSENVGQLEASMADMTEQQKTQTLEMLFGQNAVSGWMAIIDAGSDSLGDFTDELVGSEGAAKEMADTMTDNAKGGLTELKSALEGVAIQLAEILIPIFNDLVGALKRGVEWFAGLDEGTQKTIVTIAGLAAAIGPLLVVFGSMTKGLGSIVSGIGSLMPAMSGATTGVGGFRGAISGLTSPIGIAVTAIAGITTAGVLLYKHLNEESIPEIQRFGDEVSETTQEAVGAFMDLNDQATVALNQLAWSGQTVTEEMSDTIAGTFREMGTQVLAAMEESHADEIESMQAFFAEARGLTEEEQKQILENVRQSQEDQKLAVEEAQERIKEILESASEEKRSLTSDEAEEINRIQQDMLDAGIEAMSENELEQKAILERMKANATDLSARQAAEVVQNSIKQRDETIQAAEDQYNDVVKNIIRQRDELGSITEEQAEKMIAEAKRQRDETVRAAEEMHQNVVSEAKEQADEHVRNVNWSTGEIKTRWERLSTDLIVTMYQIGNTVSNTFKRKLKDVKEKMTDIGDAIKVGWGKTMNWLSGLKSRMSEVGKDVMDGLKNGISSAASSVWETTKDVGRGIADSVTGFFGIQSPSRLMMGFGEDIGEGLALGIRGSISDVERQMSALNAAASDVTARAEFSGTQHSDTSAQSSGGGDVVQHITINSPTPLSPSEVARKNMQASRQLAMEWGMR